MSDLYKCVVRRTVYNIHLKDNRLPTVKLLFEELGEKLTLKYRKVICYISLKDLCFKWRKTQNNRKLLIEIPDV